MRLYYSHLKMGASFGILYRFPRRGDGLPLHTHQADTEHRILCTSGSVRVTVQTAEGPLRHVLRAGGELETFDARAPHEILALEDGSSCFNIYRNGQPLAYAALPLAEREGTSEVGELVFPLTESE